MCSDGFLLDLVWNISGNLWKFNNQTKKTKKISMDPFNDSCNFYFSIYRIFARDANNSEEKIEREEKQQQS